MIILQRKMIRVFLELEEHKKYVLTRKSSKLMVRFKSLIRFDEFFFSIWISVFGYVHVTYVS